ncbi:cytochrome P450 [Pendulispora brunnea]|uniref:Cytochrome P450 n=1 Tax=Pendulispora brunnea TaxID=2905690 RepID=A0ABZ2KK66_9BACT
MNSSAGNDTLQHARHAPKRLKKIPVVTPWDPRNLVGFRRDPVAFLAKCVARYGDIFKFHILGIPMIMVNHPDHIEHVLVRRAENYTKKDTLIFDLTEFVLGNGLIRNPGGPEYARQRKLMQPTFRPNVVGFFTQNMIDESLHLAEMWRPAAGKDTPVNVTDDVGQIALRIVTRSLFSADVGETAREFELAFADANEVLGSLFRNPFPPLSLPSRRRTVMREATARMKRFVQSFVERRVATNDVRDDLLGMLMRATYEDDGGHMTVEQLYDEVLNLVIAAFETTTSGISWALYLIAKHPEVGQRFVNEIDTKLQGRIPTYRDLNELTYTRQIVDETLRLYTPAYQTMRSASESDDLDGYYVPAGANIYLNSYVTHRHPEFWDNPEKFDPERFSPEGMAARPKHAYFPFGSGPRICIGKYFALAELQLILAIIAQRYRLEIPPGQGEMVADQLITLHPRNGVRLLVRER